MTDRKDSILAVPDWNYNGVSQVSGTNHTLRKEPPSCNC